MSSCVGLCRACRGVGCSVGVSSVLGGGSGGFVVHPPLRYHVRLAASGRRRLVQTGGSELCLSSASASIRCCCRGCRACRALSGVGTVGTVGTVGVSLTVHAHGGCREIYYSLSGLSGYCRGCRVSGLSGLSSGCRDHVGCECRSVGPGLRLHLPNSSKKQLQLSSSIVINVKARAGAC